MASWAWDHHRWREALAGRLVHPGALASCRGWHATSEAEAGDIRARGFRQPICVAPNGVSAPVGKHLGQGRTVRLQGQSNVNGANN